MLDHSLSLRSVYGDATHACENCGTRSKALEPISARQAHTTRHLRGGDLCCLACRDGLTLDADAIDCATLDAETTGVAA
jgi:hypothetical protein